MTKVHPEFKRYSSIDNITREKCILQIYKLGYSKPDIMWTVSEKFHGSNFSVILKYDKNGEFKIVPAKRSAVLGLSDNFFSFQNALNPIKEELKTLFDGLHNTTELSAIQLYGELVGGRYEGCKSGPISSLVQKEVQYHPDNRIIFFDCVIIDEEARFFMDADTLEELVARIMPSAYFAKSLFTGTFEEAMEFSKTQYDKPTLASEMFTLTPIENNIREGHVLKPVIARFHACGGRIILKHKNKAFKERHDKKGKKKLKELPLGILSIINTLNEFITEQRLNNVLSKIGEVTSKDFGRILGDFTDDIIEDFKKEEEDLVEEFELNFKLVSKRLKTNVAIFLRDRFLNVLDRQENRCPHNSK